MNRDRQACAALLALILILGLLCGCGKADPALPIEGADAVQNEAPELPQPDVPAQPDETAQTQSSGELEDAEDEKQLSIGEDGIYTSRDEVALYIHTYGKLPSNFVTSEQARQAGWTSGSLEPYCPGKCIGGDRFGNYEGVLPDQDGRTWTECDINTLGAPNRGSERLVYSNDGLIYYTSDHFATFTLLYGEP